MDGQALSRVGVDALRHALLAGVYAKGRRSIALHGLLRYAGAGALIALLMSALVQVIAPLLLAYLVGSLVAVLADGDPVDTYGRALDLLALLGAVMLAAHVAAATERPLRELVTRRIDGTLRTQLRRIALSKATPAELAEPEVQGDLDLATKGYSSHTPGAAAPAQLMLVIQMLTAIGAAAVLATFSWPIALFTLALVLGQNALIRRQWAGESGVRTLALKMRPLQLRSDHLANTLAGVAAGKEIRVFGLSPWLLTQFERVSLDRLEPLWRKRSGVLRQQWLVFAMCVAGAVPAFVAITAAAANAATSVGALVLYLRVTILLLSSARLGLNPFIVDYGQAAFAAHQRLVNRFDRRLVSGLQPSERKIPPPSIRFEEVGFSYPGTGLDVLDGLDLEIRSGEKLAIVGLNGAGKSSLIRLLTGLQSPTRGRITVDGKEIPADELPRWWQRVAVVFQSPTHYGLSVEDNVRLGAMHSQENRDAIAKALKRAGAEGFVAGLPKGAETVLSKAFRGGVDLSGGQWQKIALARALYKADQGAGLILLDEPTAHLDVQAELDVFRTLIDTVGDRTLVLISHRFATVRHADRIVVLSEGRIAEQGTHNELLARDGDYAHWYRLQVALVSGPTERGNDVVHTLALTSGSPR